jgi:hypothetical protein
MPEAFVVKPARGQHRSTSSASKSRSSRQVPKPVVMKSSARPAQKAVDLHRTTIRGMSPSTW